jgi:hypothetical protein
MGPRLLCFAGGAALSAFFVHTGLLATPFFGSGAFLWANVFAAFLLSLALGFGLGDLIAVAAGRTQAEQSAPRLAVAGGALAWVSTYLLPDICRAVLSRDPEWSGAPAVAIALATLLPGALIAAIAPSELRTRLLGGGGGGDGNGKKPSDRSTERLKAVDAGAAGARVALRLFGLMTVGGVVGVGLSARSLLRADESDVWAWSYGIAAALVLLGLAFLGKLGRAVGVALLVGLGVLSGLRPSEVQKAQFGVALGTAWRQGQGAGLYYLRTKEKTSLTAEELRHYAEGEKSGVILTCEMLLRLGDIAVQGPGLCRLLDLVLPPDARPFIMPFFEQLESMRSDGQGTVYVRLKRAGNGTLGRRFSIPGANPGERVNFMFSDDFTIHITHDANVWRLDFGPRTTIKAGVLEMNDTQQTPVRVLGVALFSMIDASVLSIVLEDHPDLVAVKAIAQGDVGDVTTIDVQALPKEPKTR